MLFASQSLCSSRDISHKKDIQSCLLWKIPWNNYTCFKKYTYWIIWTKYVIYICRLVVLSLAKFAKRHVVVRRVVAMSPCRLAYKPILRFEPSDNVTSWQHPSRQHAVWRTSLATGRQDTSPTTHRFALCHVLSSANTTHKGVPNKPP
jgi:hypothetical protein